MSSRLLLFILSAGCVLNLFASSRFGVDGLLYEDQGNGTVSVLGFADDSVKTTPNQFQTTDLIIPSSVTYNDSTFRVTQIEDMAFSNEYAIRRVIICEGIETIGRHAFMGCFSLESIYIPASVRDMMESFVCCPSLTSIEVATDNPVFDSRNGCNAIIATSENKLIAGCRTTVVPQGVTVIGASAFANTYSLLDIELPEGLQAIEDYAFQYCAGLQSVKLPTSLKRIGVMAFSGTGLQELTVPANVNYIGEGIFDRCDCLETIRVDAGNSHYDSRNKCNAIIHTDDNTLIAGCRSTVIPPTVTKLGMYAFSNLSRLSSVLIPKGLNDISSAAFVGCTGLTHIEVSKDNTTYDSRNNCNAVVRTADDELILGCIATRIDKTVKRIGVRAFYGRNVPAILVIPSNIDSIGDYAFSKCHGLKVLYVEDGLQHIGTSVFEACDDLQSVYLPDSLERISELMFYGCVNLRTIRLGNAVKSIGDKSFTKCDRLGKKL